MQVFSVFLALQPTSEVTRDARDALYEFPNPQTAASFLFQTKPPSSLSRNWDIIVVVNEIAYRFSVDGGARFIPIKPQAWRLLKRENLDWRYPRIGSTVYSIEEITRKAIQISWPMKYSLYPETAQKFSSALFQSIRLPVYSKNTIQLFKTLPENLLGGLDRIPSPISTLLNRIKFIILLAFLASYHSLLDLISKDVFVPLKRLNLDIVWIVEITKAVSLTLLFLGKIGMKLMIGMVILVMGRDIERAERDLSDLADEVRQFDGLDRVLEPQEMRLDREDLIVFRKP